MKIRQQQCRIYRIQCHCIGIRQQQCRTNRIKCRCIKIKQQQWRSYRVKCHRIRIRQQQCRTYRIQCNRLRIKCKTNVCNALWHLTSHLVFLAEFPLKKNCLNSTLIQLASKKRYFQQTSCISWWRLKLGCCRYLIRLMDNSFLWFTFD